jgi:WD40 repeat protein
MFLLHGHRDAVRDLAYSRDGSRLVSVGEDGRLCLWDLTSRELLAEAKITEGSCETVCFGPRDEILTSDDDGFLVKYLLVENRFDGTGLEREGQWGQSHRTVKRIRTSTAGEIVALDWSGEVWFGSFPNLNLPSVSLPWLVADPIQSVALASNGDRLHAMSRFGRLESFQLRPSIRCLEGRGGGVSPQAKQIACNLDGTRVAILSTQGGIEIIAEGYENVKFENRSAILGLEFTPDGRRLIAGGTEGIRIWEIDGSSQPILGFDWQSRWVTCLAISPDGTTVASGSEDSTIAIWDMPES